MAGSGNSRPVRSNQDGIHVQLAAFVNRYRITHHRRPTLPPRLAAMEALDREVQAGRPVILDSGCGTGLGSRALARAYPDNLVIGIDKSAARLAVASGEREPDNLVFVRADCGDVWRFAREHEWPVRENRLLYPNPWPQARHLRRRWHAHPLFPDLIRLGGKLELRSNWLVYVQEFCAALAIHGITQHVLQALPRSIAPMTAFERKYAASRHRLYRVLADLDAPRAVRLQSIEVEQVVSGE